MLNTQMEVIFVHDRSCFVYISAKYNTRENSRCLQLLIKDQTTVNVWVVYSKGFAENCIGINPLFCKLLGVTEGDNVFITSQMEIPVLDELYILPDSPDDQDLLEENVYNLQVSLLDQLRVVSEGQKTIAWVAPSVPIIFTPKKTGILVKHSKVLVSMDRFYNKSSAPIPDVLNKNTKFMNIGICNLSLQKYMVNQSTFVVRTLIIDDKLAHDPIHPFEIFIHKDAIDECYHGKQIILAMMEKVESLIEKPSNLESDIDKEIESNIVLLSEIKLVTSKVYTSIAKESYNEVIPTVLVPKLLSNILQVENGTKLILNFYKKSVREPESLEIVPLCDKNLITSQFEVELLEKFKKFIINRTKNSYFITNSGITVLIEEIMKYPFTINIKPSSIKFSLLNLETLRCCNISIGRRDNVLHGHKAKHIHESTNEQVNVCRKVKSIENIVSQCKNFIGFDKTREGYFGKISRVKGHILITGPSGCGKSIICNILSTEVNQWSYTMHCRSLKGRKDIADIIKKAIGLCEEHSPSFLICDDFDALVNVDVEGAAPTDILHYNKLASTLRQILVSCVGVTVVMTAISITSLHSKLKELNGMPTFTSHFEIKENNQDERQEILSNLLSQVRGDFTINIETIKKFAMETSGYNARNLVDFVNQKIFKALKQKYKSSDKQLSLIEESIEEKQTTNDFDIWNRVGGMAEVKQQLTESLFWPLMYPSLFPTLSCGILLFGPPGTGKSYIGSSLARLNNMSFISVKGPELLSKYIGQSEKAVRDIFDKADMKKPCILFFDEFDSLASKRGHDSTGVTDRVVNQLLVRLDGAAGGTCGAVLAATSRPDLLDPALLRPGRLETHIYCPLPDQTDREEILRTLSESLDVTDDVDFQELAVRTDGFSPADLKSLLVTAQLTSLEKQLDTPGVSLQSVRVCREDLQSSLSETKPSLSKDQRLFYDNIRGHDSTGVTDRVVNQLLVRLDGAAGGTCGAVLAATSRPDLLDPALLRPGRLETHIYCPLPDQTEREEILRTLSESLDVTDDVDFQELGVRTDGFSPADLKSLLVTAQLTSLEKQLDTPGVSLQSVRVCREDLQSSLSETKPSLSKDQRLFYDNINKRFRGEKLSVKDVTMTQSQEQRVTLA